MEVNVVCNKGRINYKLCILCQKRKKEKVVNNPKKSSLENILTKLKERSWEKPRYSALLALLGKEGVTSLSDRSCKYHRSCYGQITDIDKQRRALKKREKQDNHLSKRVKVETPKYHTRSSAIPYDNTLCVFFCQEDSTMPLYNLRTFKRHKLMKEAISKSQNQILSIRFNSFCDALAGEVKYHANCMIHNVDKVLFSGNEDNTRNFENEAKKYAIEEELIQIVGNGIHTGSIFLLKDLYVSYMDALRDSNIVELRTEKTIKKYLKKMLTEEIDDIVFEKSVQRNQSERVFSSSFSSYLLDAAVCKILDDTSGNMRKISVASSIARAASLNTIRKAEKHFSTSQHVHETEVPVELFNLIRWTLGGFKDLYGKRDTKVDTIAKNICNNILYNVKTDRQVSYKSVDGGNSNSNFRHTYENAQVIGHGLTARQFGRRKGLVNLLHEKDENISNDRSLRIETGIANEIIKSIDERRFYLPPNAKKSRIVPFRQLQHTRRY